MSVFICHTGSIPQIDTYDYWLTITETNTVLPPDKHLPNLPRRLQACFDEIRDTWLLLAKRIGHYGEGGLTHMATGAAYNNDFGLMLAWSEFVRKLSDTAERILVVCDDPWLFRHFSSLPGVETSTPPHRWPVAIPLFLRGVAIRLLLGLRLIKAALSLKFTRCAAQKGGPVIVVYGHPKSDAQGNDAYFGPLMKEISQLSRALHTDCMIERARNLCRDGRSFSLHAWGHPIFALSLIFLWWRLPHEFNSDSEFWLLRRAVAYENSNGALAMTRWQTHCQARWIAETKPSVVAWPWENHPWERTLSRTTKKYGVSTVGYQHAVVGRHQFNFSPISNPDKEQSLPDMIMCNGPAYYNQLRTLGHAPSRLQIGGAFRISQNSQAYYDSHGPIYIALSSIEPISQQMLDAISVPALKHIDFVVKDHPLYPIALKESDNLKRTSLTIPESSGLRAVVYSTGTTGLEGLFASVPTYRFLPDDRIAPDILPDEITVPELSAAELIDALTAPEPAKSVDWSAIMAPVDINLWRSTLMHHNRII